MKVKERLGEYCERIAVKVCLTVLKRMSPVIKEAIDNPENLKFEGFINKDELVVKVKLKEDET